MLFNNNKRPSLKLCCSSLWEIVFDFGWQGCQIRVPCDRFKGIVQYDLMAGVLLVMGFQLTMSEMLCVEAESLADGSKDTMISDEELRSQREFIMRKASEFDGTPFTIQRYLFALLFWVVVRLRAFFGLRFFLILFYPEKWTVLLEFYFSSQDGEARTSKMLSQDGVDVLETYSLDDLIAEALFALYFKNEAPIRLFISFQGRVIIERVLAAI